MRRVFLWAARNPWLKERLPRLGFMRRAVRRFMPGETLEDALVAAAAAPGGRDRHAVHPARREPRSGPRRRTRSRPTTSRSSTRSPPPGSPARSRSSRPSSGSTSTPTLCLGAPGPHRRARRRDGVVPVDRHGGQRLHGRDDRALRAAPRRPSRGRGSACRPTCAGPPPTSSGCGRSTRPSAWSRAPTTSRSRSPTRTAARSMPTSSGWPCRFLLDGRGRPIRLGLGTHDVALIEQIADRGPCRRDRPRRVRGRDAVRHPRPISSSAWRRRAIASRRSSPTVSTGIRGTCAASRSVRPTCGSRFASCCPDRRVRTMRIAARMQTIGTESAFEVSARARALEAEGRSHHPPPDRRARLRHARQRPRGGQDGARRRGDPLPAVRRHPRAPRGDRRRRIGAQAASRSTRPRSSSRSAARGSCSTRSSAWSIRATRSSSRTRATRSTSR